MPRNNCERAPTPANGVSEDHRCPKCGAEMEPIEAGAVGLPIQQMELCPGCYLVMWNDRDGLQLRQGVPMKKGVAPDSSGEPPWLVGEPEEC